MDEKTLAEAFLRQARNDVFDGVGRVFISEFRADYEIDDETLENLIATLRASYDIRRHDDILLITLGARTIALAPKLKIGLKRIPDNIDAGTPI